MDDKHRDILRRNWSTLRRDLEPIKLLPYLVNVLDVTDEQEIKVRATREDASDKLLEILPRRGPNAFDNFVKALQGVQPHLASPLVQQSEMEEIKTELNRARTHSARLREEVQITRTKLEKERQNHKKTLKECEELKSMNSMLMTKGEEDKRLMESRLQEFETTIEQLEKQVLAERSEKEVFIEETERLRSLSDQLDEAKSLAEEELSNLKETLDETKKENKELSRKLTDYNNNNMFNETFLRDDLRLISSQRETVVSDQAPVRVLTPLCLTGNGDLENNNNFLKNDTGLAVELLETRKDLARVVKEHEESKQRCEELEKQLAETLASMERHRTASLHDRATSPGELVQFVFEDNLNCSRCDALEEEGNLLRTEKDLIKGNKEKLEEENKQMSSRIKILVEDHMRQKQTLQKELQSMKEEHETLSRDFEKELKKMLCGVNEQQLQEMKNLQGQNEDLKDQINKHKSEVHKIKVELTKEKSQVEKHHEEFLKMKKNLSREKKKVKEVKEELVAENKARKDAVKEAEKLMRELSNQEADKREDIARLREAANVERSKCDALKEEIQRLRSMPGRVLNYRKDFDRHGVLYALGTNFGTTSWVNPGGTSASPTRIIATRSSDEQGDAIDLLENRRGSLSGTKDEEKSWWCVDLTEKYALYLTHYSLRHGRDNGMSIIRNWRLEGSLDGRIWKTLKKHDNDRGLKDPFPYYTAMWAVDGELGAFRYFRIFQTGKNSSGRFSIFLSGIELYGVLIEVGG